MESENTKRLLILSEIDELKIIAKNHYLMGKFNDAIKVTEKIIEIAEKAKLYSIAREHANFIGEIYKKIKEEDKISVIREEFESIKQKYESLLKNNEISKAHQLIIEFRKKNNKIVELKNIDVVRALIETDEKIWKDFGIKETNLKKQLEPLEIQLNSYLSTNNLALASSILQKAKPLLKDLKDIQILKMWETFEAMFKELKSQVDINSKVEDALREVSELTDNYKFEMAKEILNNLIEFVKSQDFLEHLITLENKLKNISDAETKYKKLEKDLVELEKKVNDNVSNNLFQIAINNIKEIITISRFIGKTQNLEKYTKYIEEIESKIERIKIGQQIKDYVKVLNIKAVQALKKGDFVNALEKFQEIILQLKNFI
jgi:tetratricopeptide (TPR) repeat protein